MRTSLVSLREARVKEMVFVDHCAIGCIRARGQLVIMFAF